MMSEESIRQWRDIERDRVKAIANADQWRKECVILNTLNTVLEEEG